VGDAGRLDGPDLLELHLRVPEVVEEASTVAERTTSSASPRSPRSLGALNTPPNRAEFKLAARERTELSTTLRGALAQELADYVVGGTHTRRFADNLVSGLSRTQVLALRE